MYKQLHKKIKTSALIVDVLPIKPKTQTVYQSISRVPHFQSCIKNVYLSGPLPRHDVFRPKRNGECGNQTTFRN